MPKVSEHHARKFVGHLEVLIRRIMLAKMHPPQAGAMHEDTGVNPALQIDFSREDIRAMIALSTSAPRTMGDLAQSLDVPHSTATHTVGRLVDRGLVVRVRSRADRRVVEVDLSKKGKQIQECLRSQRLELAREWLTPLSRGEREIFLELMEKITTSFRD